MDIVPDEARDRDSRDLSHLVVSHHCGPDGETIQVRNADKSFFLSGSFGLDVAAGISRVLHMGDIHARDLATRFDRAISEAVYAEVARAGQGIR